MFDGGNWEVRVDELERQIRADEAQISRLRAEQVAVWRQLDRYQIDTADGARTMGDWVAAHLDLSHQTASRLMTVAHADDPEIEANMSSGKWGLDRAALLVKLRHAGVTPKLFSEAAERYSLGRLYGLVDKLRHLSPADEQDLFEYRYLVVQPNLDESAFKLWGQLPSSTGREARGRWLGEETSRTGGGYQTRPKRPPQLYHPPPSRRHPLPPASLTRRQEPSPRLRRGDKRRSTSPGPWPVEEVAEVFVDATQAAESFGEAGATVSSGPRVGPNTKMRVIVTDGDQPISYSDLGEAIPPHIRSFVLWRDQGQCSIEGCRSRYRLQPHPIQHRIYHGSHDPHNLITLRWYHHHIASHQLGFTIDPSSPTHRRQLIGPKTTTGPPAQPANL